MSVCLAGVCKRHDFVDGLSQYFVVVLKVFCFFVYIFLWYVFYIRLIVVIIIDCYRLYFVFGFCDCGVFVVS